MASTNTGQYITVAQILYNVFFSFQKLTCIIFFFSNFISLFLYMQYRISASKPHCWSNNKRKLVQCLWKWYYCRSGKFFPPLFLSEVANHFSWVHLILLFSYVRYCLVCLLVELPLDLLETRVKKVFTKVRYCIFFIFNISWVLHVLVGVCGMNITWRPRSFVFSL